MHPASLAIATQEAQLRITAAATALADRFGLADQLAALQGARSKDAQVAQLFQRRAVADLLEAVAAATAPDADEKAPHASRAKKEDNPMDDHEYRARSAAADAKLRTASRTLATRHGLTSGAHTLPSHDGSHEANVAAIDAGAALLREFAVKAAPAAAQ
ncbi:MAG: hypothetical protein AVDCRST_MAG77-3238 [uncultured Chloroflexi bacterium]|uniref:Uncharacterized protein n=1 Tax=uncultured Chloroflexota bacterium TaxID=166587 RepID=A0A6J4J6X1_9CHLR|nr:MAG: hypothetical protein AVDCRST_MAG77-3238 [uncultured Chloroflexota bacterium]